MSKYETICNELCEALEKAQPGDIKLISKVTWTIRTFNRAYYNGKPLVENSFFDKLYRAFQAYYPESHIFKEVNGESQALRPVRHLSLMPSIDTEVNTNYQALVGFYQRLQNENPNEKIELIWEPKYDGLALSLRYVNGILEIIATRGNGEVGENVTHNAHFFGASIPSTIPALGTVEIRGEGLLTYSEFERINALNESDGKEAYSNPRNAAAGIIRSLTPPDHGPALLFIPYGFGPSSDIPEGISSQYTALKWLRRYFYGLRIDEVQPSASDDIEYIFSCYQGVEARRKLLPFMVDGVVYKVNSLEQQKRFGMKTSTPRWAMAHKFAPEETKTTVLDIVLQVGRSGKITPVAKVATVYVGGVDVSSITLHNAFDLRKRNVRVGDIVTIRRAGDVIPEIVPEPDKKRPVYVKNTQFKFCPCCETSLERPYGDRNYYCPNIACYGRQQASYEHFVGREAMDIKNLGPETVEMLTASGVLNSWLDFFKMDVATIDTAGKTGRKVAEKIHAEIQACWGKDYWRLLHGISIPLIGASSAKLLAEVLDPKNVFGTLHMVERIPNFGPERFEQVRLFFSDPINLDRFKEFVFDARFNMKIPKKLSNKFEGRTFVLTGSFSSPRTQYEDAIKANGGKTSSSVSKATAFIVAGNKATTHKVEAAKKLGIQILNEESFLNLLNN